MATTKSKYIQVTAEQTSCDAQSATYKCTVSRINKGVFVLCDKNYHLAIKKSAENPTMLWGFPTDYAKYNYSAASNLKNGTSVDIGAGYGKLPSKIVNSYSWTETVKIDRTNKRQGSKTIKVGIKTGSKGTKDFKPELVSLTLKTLEIAKPNKPTITVTVDDEKQKTRYIRINITMNNPENFYTAKLFDGSGKQIGDSHTNSWEETILIDKNYFETTQNYTVKITGKDGTLYHEVSSSSGFIKASGVGVQVKVDNMIQDVNTAHFKNANIKTISEVWIKKDGKVYQIRK